MEHTNQSNRTQRQLSVPELLAKLDELYDKEEHLKIEMRKLQISYAQLQEEKELMQSMIVFAGNKRRRMKEYHSVESNNGLGK